MYSCCLDFQPSPMSQGLYQLFLKAEFLLSYTSVIIVCVILADSVERSSISQTCSSLSRLLELSECALTLIYDTAITVESCTARILKATSDLLA